MAHNTYSRCVTSDNDLEGLVAYSLYKQDKIEWIAHRTATNPNNRPPTDEEIEDNFIKMIRESHITQYRANANVLLNRFANSMLASELELERESIKNDALIRSFNPPWYKKLWNDTLANLASSAVITALIVIAWVVSSAPSNFIGDIIAKAVQGQIPAAAAAGKAKDQNKDH